jgi:hypothetical protein
VGSSLTVTDTTFNSNQALGGDGGGGPGGFGAGGALENQGIANVDHDTFTSNLARGGATAGGGIVGLASGGAIDNQNGGSLSIPTLVFPRHARVGLGEVFVAHDSELSRQVSAPRRACGSLMAKPSPIWLAARRQAGGSNPGRFQAESGPCNRS